MDSYHPQAPWIADNGHAYPGSPSQNSRRPGAPHSHSGPPHSSVQFSRSGSGAPASFTPLPPSLVPGRNRGQSLTASSSPDLFFQQPPSNRWTIHKQPSADGFLRHPQSAPPIPPHPPGMRQIRSTTTPPEIPPKPSTRSAPLIPPKIPLYPQVISASTPRSPTHIEETPSQVEEEEELARALALSAAEAQKGATPAQEDEELARALKNSLLSGDSDSYFPRTSPEAIQTTFDSQASTSAVGSSTSSPASPRAKPYLSRRGTGSSRQSWQSFSSESHRLAQVEEDEALARQLAAEEQEATASEPEEHLSSEPPLYSSAVRSRSVAPSGLVAHVPPELPVDLALPSPPPPFIRSAPTKTASLPRENVQDDAPAYSRSAPAPPPIPLPPPSEATLLDGPSTSGIRTPRHLSHMASSSRLPVLGESQEDNLRNSEVSPSPGPSVTANDFVEPHLLDGISLGFFSPVVSARTTRFAGPLPNVISLPYGKCAPLHMQAPNWRHLLKLMARLSGTRIEPTLDAVAVNKSELKLRTVIQFVKVHHASAEWRTLIWLTIDVPPHPGKDVTYTVSGEVLQRKYNAGDVSSLPYSYTLSTVPALLRDNPESALSKYYVIPSTTQLPYPTLPITFPDYAVYLQAALRESRKALHDSTSGMRRLARMVETCYPSEAESPDDDDEGKRRKMGVLFKRVIGRGNRPSRERFGNEDTYEMVTPFVINEWG